MKTSYQEIIVNQSAINLYNLVLDIDVKTIGESHPSYAIHLSNQASLYESMEDYR